MFFPKAMSQIELIVPSKDLLRVTKVLGGHGAFHQAEGGLISPDSELASSGNWQEKATAFGALERRVQAALKSLRIPASQPAATGFSEMVEAEAVTPALERIETRLKQTVDHLAEDRKRLEQVEALRRQLEPVEDIDLDMTALRGAHYVFPMLGTMPAENVARLQTSLNRIPHVLLVIREDPRRPVVWLAGTRSNRDLLERAARSAYLETLAQPGEHLGTPRQILGLLQREGAGLRESIATHESLLTQLAQDSRDELLRLAWEIHASRTLTDAIVRFGRLRHTYIIVGWVPTEELEFLTGRIKQASRETLIETVAANRSGDKRNVPVALSNSKLLRPFQMLVTTYARPRYGELDPTWLIALTFPLLFGAMFGDVGHGLLLAGLGALISSRRVKALHSLASLGGLIAICGLVAAVFGVLYGSVFGYESILQAVWMHPLQNILTILIVAVGAGVVLLTIGFLIGIFNAWVSRDWGHLLFGHNGIAGFLLYWSLLGLGASLSGLLKLPPAIFIWLAVIAGLAVMFSEPLIRLVDGERPLVEGGLSTYAIQAPVELFEAVVSLLSNSLSYVRVGAFAVAHGGLSSAIFILAKLAGPEFGVGYWIVVAIGNVFIVGFEGLIVGIQTMRLSYYEFFSKFFSGGGMRFEPLLLTPPKEE